MKKILYFTIGFIILLVAILFALSNYDDGSNFKSPLYEYTTLCSNKHCLPLDNLLINKKVEIKDPEKIENQFNQWLLNNSETCFVRAKYSQAHQCSLTAYNNIDFDAAYLTFNLSNVLHDNIINKEYFDQKMNTEKLLKDEQIFNSWQITSQVQKVILNFLYHLTHLENSKFKPWISTLPKSISPLYNNFTYHELQLIEGDTIHNWVLQIVDQYKRDYKTLLTQIRNTKANNNNNKEEEFFNGYKLNLQDYVYVRYLCDIYGWNIQNSTTQDKKKEKNSKLFLVPGSNCLTKKAPETLMKYDGFHLVHNFSSFQFQSDRQFKYSDVIEENYEVQDNAIVLTLRGISPSDNPFDCIQTQIYDQELMMISQLSYVMQIAKFLGGSNAFLCLQPKMQYLSAIKYLGNYMNQNATIKRFYYEQLARTNNSQDKMELVSKWPNVEWKKYNPIEIPLSSLNNQIKFFTSQLNNMTDYYNLRQSNNKNSFNAERIKQYLELKLVLIEQVKESVLELGNENKKLFNIVKEEKTETN